MADEDVPDPPPHQARFVSGGIAVVGAFYAVIGVLRGEPIGTLGGLALTAFGLVSARLGTAVQIANSAAAAINGGDERRARVLIARARGRHRMGYVVRMLDSHESELAWRAGDLDAALRLTEAALARKDLLPIGRWSEIHRTHVMGLRALALAAKGDPAARQSIAEVRGSEVAWPTPVARVELAEAILRLKEDDLAGAQRHLAEHRALLAESLDPRGRTLARAVRSLAEHRTSEVYRLPLRAALRDHDARAEWLARVFPKALSNQVDDAPIEREEEAPAAIAAAKAPEPSPAPAAAPKKRMPRRRMQIAAIWIVLVFAFVVIWSFVPDTPSPGPRPPRPTLDFVFAFAPLFLIAVVFVQVRRSRAKHQVLAQATRALARMELDRAEEIARRYLEDANVTVAATAALTYASSAERRADFAEALRRCDAGLARVSNPLSKSAVSDILGPQLVSLRAFLLAALGRNDESLAALARLDREYPTFAYAPAARARARLLLAARAGDLDEASAAAAQRDDFIMGASAELVADLVVAARAPDRAARAESLREELAASPVRDAWIRAAVPNLVEAVLARRPAKITSS